MGVILQSPCPSVRSHFRNRYLSFYWKKWFYIWHMALAWWLVPCLPFPGLPHIYFLFTVRLTNERVGVFLARRSMQHLVMIGAFIYILHVHHVFHAYTAHELFGYFVGISTVSVWQLLGVGKIQNGSRCHGNQGAKNVKFTLNFTKFCSNVSCHIHI